MNFLSIIYALFLIGVLGVYWSVRSVSKARTSAKDAPLSAAQSKRMWILLIASLIFYASLQVAYVPLLVVITFINFRLGKAIGANAALGQQAIDQRISNEDWQKVQAVWNRRRLNFLWLGIVLNIILLVSFKYVPFFLNSIAGIFNWQIAEDSATWVGANLVVPLGLSFFVFECIAYLIDVYRGAPPTKKFLDFAAYKLFFPKLIIGPITRFHYFASQMKALQFPTLDQFTEGFWLIACGAVKKALLADNLAFIVDLIWGNGNLQRAGSVDLWLAMFAYGLQIYLDFSGYVDWARGSAILLGINLPENFDFPYFSTSIAQFWRRWHMTLGDWLRNYLYFPLGGSRRGLGRTCLNLLIVMLIAGIWHGAAWGFVVWGGLHGLALVVHRLTEAVSNKFKLAQTWWKSIPGVVVAWLLTQLMVFTSWIFFKLPNLKDSVWVVQHLWGHNADIQFAQKVYGEAIRLDQFQLSLLLIFLVALMGVAYIVQRGLKLQLNWPLKLLLVPMCLYTVWVLAPTGGSPFIYFDF